MEIKELLTKYKDYGIELRRHFHMYPEAALKEYKTSARIEEELKKMGLEPVRIIETGIICDIKGKNPGKTIALRADIDALELNDTIDKDYCSKIDGMKHGCGHDGHAASLLQAAQVLNELKGEFDGTVRLLFQPAEEVAEGAKRLMAAGALDGCDGIFGLHLWNETPVGKIDMAPGTRMASAGIFKITVTGKGGHGSLPHQGVDAVLAGSAVVMALQSAVSRELSPYEPAVLTVGSFKAGSRFNIIAQEAEMEGTTRCFSYEINDSFEGIMQRIIEQTAAAYRATGVLDYKDLVLPTINNPQMAEIGIKGIAKTFGQEALIAMPPVMGGEDFSFYAKKLPIAFAFVGSANPSKLETFPHHHPSFDVDEDSLYYAAGTYVSYALEFLRSDITPAMDK